MQHLCTQGWLLIGCGHREQGLPCGRLSGEGGASWHTGTSWKGGRKNARTGKDTMNEEDEVARLRSLLAAAVKLSNTAQRGIAAPSTLSWKSDPS
jgi:hypothetical protein